MAADDTNRSHGLNLPRNPLEDKTLPGTPPGQAQPWPGSDAALRPQADHGEESYRGGDKLPGLKALITGGDSGIGRAVAIAFAREGADVAFTYVEGKEEEDAKETTRWIEKAGRKALAIGTDLRRQENCRAAVERTVRELGGLNILVNNAAFHIEAKDFRDIPAEQLENTFRTNVFSYVWMAQEAARRLKGGDVVINTGSVVALMPYPQLTDYSATKAAVLNLTRNMAVALAPEGVRVNCVAPGPVWTPLIAATRDEEFVAEFGAKSLWHRPAQPAELAPSYVFLASTDSRYYTGEVLCPSGYPTTTR
ncbi:SDR family oxidoreductase [Falsiroseomonas sp.]|uniref:SDR family oxidoreductase n=1 Tax=Falsiroseomonas sp. TaxID=2870721 RepID=UPI003567CE5F